MARVEEGYGVLVREAVPILFSAGTYLFDLFSNVAVTIKYYQHSADNPIYSWLFSSMVVLLFFAHVVNALIFALKFPKKSAAIKAAYFLPLIQLYRLLNLVWRTGSLKLLKDVTSKEMNVLFSILGTGMETGPLLTVQFIALNILSKADVRITALISIVASLASTAYNVGMAVMWTSKNAKTLKQKVAMVLAAGSFSSSALVLRCFTFFRVSEVFQYTWLPPTILCLALLAIDWLFFLLLLTHTNTLHQQNPFNYKKLIRAFGFSHMSFTVGPLYPMVDEGMEQNILGQSVFRFRVLCMALANVLPDIIVTLLVVVVRGLEFPTYLAGTGVAGAVYIFSTLCYFMVDKRCGIQTMDEDDREDHAHQLEDGKEDHAQLEDDKEDHVQLEHANNQNDTCNGIANSKIIPITISQIRPMEKLYHSLSFP